MIPPRPAGGFRFQDRDPDSYRDPLLNPFLQLHRDFGPPVLTASQAQQAVDRWDQVYGHPAPLHVEIGSGNGFYLSHMASLHPEWNWLGIEIRFKRVVLTARKLRAAGAENARQAQGVAAQARTFNFQHRMKNKYLLCLPIFEDAGAVKK